MHLTARTAIVAALLLLPSLGRAQESQPQEPPSSQIVVTGERIREEQVRDFVDALMPTRGRSMPRFIDEFCPVTAGLIPAQNEAVTARLRRVAGAAGLNVGRPGCVPNALVIVTRNKNAFIRTLAERRPYSFGMMSALQIRRLAQSPGPAAAWQLSGPIDSSGTPLRFDETLGMYVNDTSEAASRIRSTSQIGFDASALVVESGALKGLTAVQLADYAAMRLLARLDPARLPAPSPPTILNVLEAPMGSEVPITMTQWDLGLLRGLYASSLNLHAGGHRSQIVRQVAQEVGTPKR